MPTRRPSQIVLIYCEGGFAERALGDVRMLLAKPGNRRAPIALTLTA
jgi:cyclopropane-fatty-acyl-phospholipid synthase